MPSHIKYLSDDQSICVYPARMEAKDLIYIKNMATVENLPCKDCNAILMAWNEKNAREDELLYEYNRNARKNLMYVDVEPKATRGLTWGVLISSLLWIFVCLFLVKVF